MNIFLKSDLNQTLNNLTEEESRHCTKVLRLSKGDHIFLVDGKGTFCEGIIEEASHKACNYRIIKKTTGYGKRQFSLSVAIAPTKNIDRFEWFLEKATEIGIDQIIPIICRYSEKKEIKKERLEKILIAAMKQSQKAYLPELCSLKSFSEMISTPFPGDRFIAHCFENDKTLLKNAVLKGRNILICIGPEGDFSNEEVKNAILEGFTPVSLGDSRLRTETAGLVACHTVNLINQF